MSENETNKQSNPKLPWGSPEIIEVGAVLDVTEGENQNVGEPGTTPRTYSLNKAIDPDAEVDLGDK
jgi:hypothetical protein